MRRPAAVMVTFLAVVAIAVTTGCGGDADKTSSNESPTPRASSPTVPPEPTPTVQSSIKSFTVALIQTSAYRCDPSSACPPPPGIICDADFEGAVSGDIEGAVSGTGKSTMTERDPAITLSQFVEMSDCTMGQTETTLSSCDGTLVIQTSGTLHQNYDTGGYTAEVDGSVTRGGRDLPIRCKILDGRISNQPTGGRATLQCTVR